MRGAYHPTPRRLRVHMPRSDYARRLDEAVRRGESVPLDTPTTRQHMSQRSNTRVESDAPLLWHGGTGGSQVGAHDGRDIVDDFVSAGVGVAMEATAHAAATGTNERCGTWHPRRPHKCVPVVGVGVDAAIAAAEPLCVHAGVVSDVVQALEHAGHRDFGFTRLGTLQLSASRVEAHTHSVSQCRCYLQAQNATFGPPDGPRTWTNDHSGARWSVSRCRKPSAGSRSG